MATLSGPQLTQLALNAGFPPADAPTASAVALAESSGRTDAISPTGDYGVMQINMKAHPELFRQYVWNDPSGLQNMEMAFQVWLQAGRSFRPWTTFTSGRYKLFLGKTGSANGSGVAGATAGGLVGTGTGDPAADPNAVAPAADPAAGVAAFITSASDATFWTRVAMFLAGVLLCLVALNGLLSHTSAYKTLKTAVKVAAL